MLQSRLAKTASKIGKSKEEFDPPGMAGLSIVNAVVGGAKKVAEGVKNRLYENIYPYGYSSQEYNKETGVMEEIGPGTRLYRALVENKREMPRQAVEDNPQGYEKEKMDLWGMYLGKGQKYNTITKSSYTPTRGSGKGTYFSIPKLEEQIGAVGEIKAKDFNDFKNQVLVSTEGGKFGFNAVEKSRDEAKGKIVANVQPLGDATISVGEDDKGYYISYYDKWDINPFSGGSRVTGKISSALGLDKLDDITGTEGPEIYGRIYFDKKTGKRIK
jgi:hypothetical protein